MSQLNMMSNQGISSRLNFFQYTIGKEGAGRKGGNKGGGNKGGGREGGKKGGRGGGREGGKGEGWRSGEGSSRITHSLLHYTIDVGRREV